jgi:hypothetical protein
MAWNFTNFERIMEAVVPLCEKATELEQGWDIFEGLLTVRGLYHCSGGQ